MHHFEFAERRVLEEQTTGTALAEFQLARLNELHATVLRENSFYRHKLRNIATPLASLTDLTAFPFTTKQELIPDEPTGWAKNLTYAPHRYVRFHRTSGTHGRPLTVVDTADDWQWWLLGWQFVLDAADISPSDRALLAFSFGPFVGFWSAFDAAVARGCLAIPTGGMNTLARLELLQSTRATAVFCTPSYALHLADVAAGHGFDLANCGVRRIVVAGEPGGSISATRQRIEQAWGATVIDHAGATEIGPWGYQAFDGETPVGLHVNEALFLPEFISVANGEPARDGELSELVLTTLGRAGCPVIRYRTGDLVKPYRDHHLKNRFVLLAGGVLGRADDMVVIRGVNIFPSSIEAIVREFSAIGEFRIVAFRDGAMDALRVEIEDAEHAAEKLSRDLQLRLGLKVEVATVPANSLPRTEGKSQRFVDQRREKSW